MAEVTVFNLCARIILFGRPERLDNVMTGTAVEAVIVILFGDFRVARLHGKTDIDITDSAGVFCPVQAMSENNQGHILFFGKIIYHHIAVIMQLGPFFLGPEKLKIQWPNCQEKIRLSGRSV